MDKISMLHPIEIGRIDAPFGLSPACAMWVPMAKLLGNSNFSKSLKYFAPHVQGEYFKPCPVCSNKADIFMIIIHTFIFLRALAFYS